MRYGIFGLVNRRWKFLKEIVFGINEVTCRLPDGLRAERKTR
jgi:hypothetical protein